MTLVVGVYIVNIVYILKLLGFGVYMQVSTSVYITSSVDTM